jgi:hypothetical protein
VRLLSAAAPEWRKKLRFFKWIGNVLLTLTMAVLVAGCGNNPTPQYTPDGFDPPYNYY